MSMFFRSKQSWMLISSIDPRWNSSGQSENVSGLVVCKEAEKKIKELEALYGKRPSDLEYKVLDTEKLKWQSILLHDISIT